MKNVKKSLFLLLAGALVVLACQENFAASPDLGVRPDATLTNEQIQQKIDAFRAVHAVNATPGEAVAAKFKSQFAAAYDVEWEMASGVYEVEFKIAKVDYKAWYDADGNLLMLQQDIAPRQLPKAVQDAVKKKYPKFSTDDAEKFFKGTEVIYEVSVEKGEQEFKAYFKEDGTFVEDRRD